MSSDELARYLSRVQIGAGAVIALGVSLIVAGIAGFYLIQDLITTHNAIKAGGNGTINADVAKVYYDAYESSLKIQVILIGGGAIALVTGTLIGNYYSNRGNIRTR